MFFNAIIRPFHTSLINNSKKIPKNIKGHSSNQWLARQFADPFVQMAKQQNYR